jgi:hypothetical protein
MHADAAGKFMGKQIAYREGASLHGMPQNTAVVPACEEALVDSARYSRESYLKFALASNSPVWHASRQRDKNSSNAAGGLSHTWAAVFRR